MPQGSTTTHEPLESLSAQTVDQHRAIVSLQEELEAVDWYRQRADACQDEELRTILLHNMGEEMEHASMLLEWLRRREPLWDEHLRTYLFTEVSVTEIEEAATQSGDSGTPAEQAKPGFTVGPMKGG